MSRLCALYTLLLLPILATVAQDWSKFPDIGPYQTKTTIEKLPIGNGNISQLVYAQPKQVDITLTFPSTLESSEQVEIPVVVFYNGFLLQALNYNRLANYIASYGFFVVRYDLFCNASYRDCPLFRIHKLISSTEQLDEKEITIVEDIKAWLDSKDSPTVQELPYGLATHRLVLAGHSRGGKLAYMTNKAYPQMVETSVLIDPVDCSQGDDNCIRDFEKGRLPTPVVGIAGAGRTESSLLGSNACNPCKRNYVNFCRDASDGSWVLLSQKCGHLQYLSRRPWFLTGLKGPLLGGLSCRYRQDRIIKLCEEQASVFAMAWLGKHYGHVDIEAKLELWLEQSENVSFAQKQGSCPKSIQKKGCEEGHIEL